MIPTELVERWEGLSLERNSPAMPSSETMHMAFELRRRGQNPILLQCCHSWILIRACTWSEAVTFRDAQVWAEKAKLDQNPETFQQSRQLAIFVEFSSTEWLLKQVVVSPDMASLDFETFPGLALCLLKEALKAVNLDRKSMQEVIVAAAKEETPTIETVRSQLMAVGIHPPIDEMPVREIYRKMPTWDKVEKQVRALHGQSNQPQNPKNPRPQPKGPLTREQRRQMLAERGGSHDPGLPSAHGDLMTLLNREKAEGTPPAAGTSG